MKSYTLSEINDIVKGEIIGNTSNLITGAEQLEKANKNQVSFIVSKKFLRVWKNSKASIAIIEDNIVAEPGGNKAFIKVKNAELAMAQLLSVFDPGPPVLEPNIHPSAVVDHSAQIGTNCKIGAGCYIGKNVVIHNNAIIYPNTTILDESKIGVGTIIWSNTVIRERTEIGAMCIIHTNVSIGADGFGFRPSEDGLSLVKIPQIGNVIIGNAVEIGANTCVDRGKFSSTYIGDGTKIDNLVQIAHNCNIGRSCIIAGTTGLAGGVTLEDGVMVGGGVSIKEQCTLHTGCKIGAGTGIMNDVAAGKTMLGYPAQEAKNMLKEWALVRKFVKEYNK